MKNKNLVTYLVIGAAAFYTVLYVGYKLVVPEKPETKPVASVSPSPSVLARPLVDCPKGFVRADDWTKIIYSDIQLYVGDDSCKQYLAYVVGGNNDEVLIQYPSGERNWKKRQAIYDQTWVRQSDPAYQAKLWRKIEN